MLIHSRSTTSSQQRERSILAQQGVWQSFWRCYASRCADAAQTCINYMDLLNQRDKLRFHPSAQSARAVLAMGANLLSTRYDAGIDDTKFAVEHVCEQEATELRQVARMRATGNLVDDALKLWDEPAVLPVYARWTACRDSVEYLMRP